MRAVIYRMSANGKTFTQVFDSARGESDPGENQARSNLLAAVLQNGHNLTDEIYLSFTRTEVN